MVSQPHWRGHTAHHVRRIAAILALHHELDEPPIPGDHGSAFIFPFRNCHEAAW